MSQRTPLAKVRGLGSAKEGTDHFWKQRVTAVANLVLVCWLFVVLVKIAGADYDTVKRTLARPQNAIAITLLMLSAAMHMRLGMQVIIEDYVHTEGRKIFLLMLNSFFTIVVALSSIYAILKLSFGA
ncbi:MAG: succinate dehydrogenase, hydrophobic membrane anchor protein [Hyphomicrobiales bacterium]|nr:MAG: succinate dehydrogenase, hydrophobic membrane anchor protein [Hyphomicrobiales bacterium]